MARCFLRLIVAVALLLAAAAPVPAGDTPLVLGPALAAYQRQQAARTMPRVPETPAVASTTPAPLPTPEAIERLRAKLPLDRVARLISPRVNVPGLGTCAIGTTISRDRVAIVLRRRFNP